MIPGEPFAKQRPRFTRTGGVYTPRETVAYEMSVAWQARASKVKFGSAEVGCSIDFFCGKKRKLDLDNAIKAVTDGAEKGQLYENDSQLTDIHGRIKSDPENPRVEARFWEIAE